MTVNRFAEHMFISAIIISFCRYHYYYYTYEYYFVSPWKPIFTNIERR